MRLYENQPSGTVARARQLRREAPEPERRLLRALKAAFPDLKWRHQVPVGPYYADILCVSERLVIEVDGDAHVGAETRDAFRTVRVEREHYRVLRFTNHDVMTNLEGVIAQLSLSVREREVVPKTRKGEGDPRPDRIAPSPSPSHVATRRGPLPLPQGEEA